MSLTLQKCDVSNLSMLVDVSRTTFIDAFEKDNEPENFKAYIEFAFDRSKIMAELKNPETTFYFVYEDKNLVGYLKLNEKEAQTDIKSGGGMELERIYVLQQYQGRQIGQWILNEVKKIAYEKQGLFLWLGVWEHNVKAIKFYKKHGFSKFGTHPYYVGKDKQTDWMMRFDLEKNAPGPFM